MFIIIVFCLGSDGPTVVFGACFTVFKYSSLSSYIFPLFRLIHVFPMRECLRKH